MNFLCKLLGCKEKTVYRDVEKIVYATKEPAKPQPLPVLSGSVAEQAEQVKLYVGILKA